MLSSVQAQAWFANSTPFVMLPCRMEMASFSADSSYGVIWPRGRNSSTPSGPSLICKCQCGRSHPFAVLHQQMYNMPAPARQFWSL